MQKLSGVIALGVCLLAPAPVFAQSGQEEGERTGLRWRNRPSIQIGEHVRLDLRLKLSYDWRRFDPEIGEEFRGHGSTDPTSQTQANQCSPE